MSDIYFCIYLLVSSNFKDQKKKPRYFETSIASFFGADNDKGDNAEQGFYDHGAVANHRHIFFVADRLGGSS